MLTANGGGNVMSARLVVYILVYLPVYIPVSTFAGCALKRVRYIQGQVTDTLILYTGTPGATYVLPKPSIQKISSTSGLVRATFFVPAVTYTQTLPLGHMCAALKKSALYRIRAVPVVSPVQGVQIELLYKQDKLAWQYYTVVDKQTNCSGVMLLLHDTQAVNALVRNTIRCPIRWYSGIKHQPRIVLDVDKKIKENTGYLARFVRVLRVLLTRQGYEVFTLDTTCTAFSPDARTSYMQCQIRADFCIVFTQKPFYRVRADTKSKSVWSTLGYSQERKLNQLYTYKRAQSRALASMISRQIGRALVATTAGDTNKRFHEYYVREMPTVVLTVGENTLVKQARALVHTIRRYYFRQKNSSALY